MQNQKNTFLPDGDNVPKSDSKYAKLEQGDNKFIILGSVVFSWIYWNTENKPVRLKEKPEKTPDDIGVDKKTGKQKNVQHSWAFPVYNLSESKPQVLEITQKSLMGALQDLSRDADWGDPILNYQINIKKSGQDLKTTYQILPSVFKGDIEKIKQEYEESDIDMSKYFEKEEKDTPMETHSPYDDEPNPDDIKM